MEPSGSLGLGAELWSLATTGQQVLVATERRVHGLLVASLVPQLAPDIDAIVLAEGDTRLITNFRNFLYCGR